MIIRKDKKMDLKQNIKLLQNCYSDYINKRDLYFTMYRYAVEGESDARIKYKNNKSRSNLKVKANFIKKFIKEEVSYLLSNKPTLIGQDPDAVELIKKKTAHWNETHDKELLRDLLTFGVVFELYYLRKEIIAGKEELQVSSKVVNPLDGYVYFDENLQPLLFMRFYKKKFDTTEYVDIYTKDRIYHTDAAFSNLDNYENNIFGFVPVTYIPLSKYREKDTIFNDIKDIQDGYETNLSDIVNEISDYRLAYFLALGCNLDDDVIEKMKEKGILNTDEKDVDMRFLTKDINDTFVQNTLSTLEKQLYNMAGHVDTGEQLASNISGTALRNRLISLEQRVRDTEAVMQDACKNRHKVIFSVFNRTDNTTYDYRDLSVKYTLNIPQDDLVIAQMLSQTPDGVISKETARGLFSFINNTSREAEKVKQEEIEGVQDINLDHV